MDLIVVWVVENDIISVRWIGVDLVFGVAGKKYLFLASGSKSTEFLFRGIEIDLILEW